MLTFKPVSFNTGGVYGTGALETSSFMLADTSSMIVLFGLVLAVILVLTLAVITVVCFRRHSRRNRKYRSVSRDPPGGDLPLKAFPEVGGPTHTYHTGCDLGLSTSDSVCLCREMSGGAGDRESINSAGRPRSGCRGCDGMMTSSHKMAESEYHRRCPAAEVSQS